MSIAVIGGLEPPHFHLQRLEYRVRRAQSALACARAYYGSLYESSEATATQLHLALRQIEETERYLLDLQSAVASAGQRASK